MSKAIWWLTVMCSSMALAATATVPPGGADNRPIIPPRETHPFGALETHPLWDRPVDRAPLPDRIERDVDRGEGRVEDPTTFELKQIRREQIDPSGTLAAVKEQQRQDDVEAIRLKTDREANRVKRYEREDEVLAKERRDWATMVQRENAAGGAVVDRMALDRMEADYRAAIDAAVQRRDDQLAAVRRTGGDAREVEKQRAEILQQFESARSDAERARAARREVILGHP
jgi:hypothetical protein